MKKINTDALEKMAKEKNIDKNMIEDIANGYMGKSENELMDELIKIGQNLKGKEEVVSKFKAFLDKDQQKKLDVIMNKISQAELQNKIDNKKGKSSSPSNKSSSSTSPKQSSKKPSSGKKVPSPNVESSPAPSSTKKVKKVVKKVKKPKN